MRDLDLRLATLCELRRQHEGDASTRVVQEMGIWSGSVRVDIAVINGELQGFELKSDKDTLGRLPAQADLYSKVFDRTTLVVGKKHLDKAVSMIPCWWGIASAIMVEGNVVITNERIGGLNPCIDIMQVVRLLWKDEALAILERRSSTKGLKSKPVATIHQHIIELLEHDTVKLEVRTALKARTEWLT